MSMLLLLCLCCCCCCCCRYVHVVFVMSVLLLCLCCCYVYVDVVTSMPLFFARTISATTAEGQWPICTTKPRFELSSTAQNWGHLFYEGGMRSGSQSKLCSRDTTWETSLNASRGIQENGNANEQAVVKNLPVPFIADFWFRQISSHDEISVKKHCDCSTTTLVIRVDRPTFVSLVTTTGDIPRVEVMFPDWEMWPATVRVNQDKLYSVPSKRSNLWFTESSHTSQQCTSRPRSDIWRRETVCWVPDVRDKISNLFFQRRLFQ